mmetsp:Transcript_124783/g.360961  ORF Transcript_124783/g.360961 Transcript_124783/m.360961 type:complete len:537 (+) Transcript_124783:62-1672(+)
MAAPEGMQVRRQRSHDEGPLMPMAGALPPHLEPGFGGEVGDASLLPWLPSPLASPARSPRTSGAATPQDGHPLLVMKFGGSSLATPELLRRAAEIIRDRLDRRPIVVLSAMGKTTNELLAAAERAFEKGEVDITKVKQIAHATFEHLGVDVPQSVSELLEELHRILSGIALLKEISGRTRDRVVSFGERLSVRVFSTLFNHIAMKELTGKLPEAKPVDSWEAGMTTTSGGGSANSAFSQCEVLPETYLKLNSYFYPLRKDYSYLPVFTGYIAKDPEGNITTLGRDGSDLTATVVGAAVQASEVQIWKDVSGVMTTDPRVVPAARPVSILTFEEAAELSTFGSKVVHPAAILPAWLVSVPISVRNSTAPEQPGTRITSELESADLRDGIVAAMSTQREITMIIIRSTRMLGQHGFLANVFEVLHKYEVSVDVIATSEVTVSLTLDRGYRAVDLDALKNELEKVSKVEVREGMGMVTLITSRKDSTTVLRQAFEVFENMQVPVEMVSAGASNVNVTFVIQNKNLLDCARSLHERFFER